MSEPREIGAVKHDVQQDGSQGKWAAADVEPGPFGGELDAALERRVRRKLDRVVLSLTFIAYLLGFLDRSNIGNAQQAGMGAALGFDDAHYQWLLTIFYIPYSKWPVRP
jgi:hypothetical protein